MIMKVNAIHQTVGKWSANWSGAIFSSAGFVNRRKCDFCLRRFVWAVNFGASNSRFGVVYDRV